MGTYKGNAGHLMQHWTLCELLDIADEENVPGLSFVDAHAMAPVAHTRDPRGNDQYHILLAELFDRARVGLPGRQSVYERAWNQLVPNGGYPNSAAFVNQVWTRDFSMLLCEINPETITEIDTWLPIVRRQPRCKRAKVFPGDWRGRFRRGLPSPSKVGLPNGSLTLVSFDPYVCWWQNVDNRRPGNLYPDDIKLVRDAMENMEGGILIQISTYNANGPNKHPDVINTVNGILNPTGFALYAQVTYNGHMMSLVYARNVTWKLEHMLADMPNRFTQWRDDLRRP